MERLLLDGRLPDARWPANGLASTMHYRNGKPATWWRSEPVVTPQRMPGTSPACGRPVPRWGVSPTMSSTELRTSSQNLIAHHDPGWPSVTFMRDVVLS
jgi:hypothetical protein